MKQPKKNKKMVEKQPNKFEPSIESLAKKLQEAIDIKMTKFDLLGKEYKELLGRIDTIKNEMAAIFKDLRPVESLVRNQNPDKEQLFNSLTQNYE